MHRGCRPWGRRRTQGPPRSPASASSASSAAARRRVSDAPNVGTRRVQSKRLPAAVAQAVGIIKEAVDALFRCAGARPDLALGG